MVGAILLSCAVLSCGCFNKPKEPKISVDEVEFKNVSTKETNLNIRIIVDNPNSIGVHVNKISFDVYYIDNEGKSKYLGHGEKENIDIRPGKTTIEIPLTLLNERLIKALEGRGEKLTLEIDGSANVDLKVTGIDVPFKQKVNVKIPESIKSQLEYLKKLGIGFTIKDFKKPDVSAEIVDGYIDATDRKLYLKAIITVSNPNPIDIGVDKIKYYVYYLDNGQKKYLGEGEKENVIILKSTNSSFDIDTEIPINPSTLNAIIKVAKDKKITILLSGEVKIREIKELGIPSIGIPFEVKREINITKIMEEKLNSETSNNEKSDNKSESSTSNTKTNTETNRKTETNENNDNKKSEENNNNNLIDNIPTPSPNPNPSNLFS